MLDPEWITADWPAPPQVHALTTLRRGGHSNKPFDGFNLAAHVGDDPDAVLRNRARLNELLQLPSEPAWLHQVHGCVVTQAGDDAPEADASIAHQPGQVCAVLTADCLPVLLCDRQGTRVAAVHAGWRGLAAGVLESTVDALGIAGSDLLVWLGPAIGPQAFETGAEVRDAFMQRDVTLAHCFESTGNGKWHADLYALAKELLASLGITAIYGGGWCTHREDRRFFSFRRDAITGRMASLIWLSHD